MEYKFEKLEYAKQAVMSCLEKDGVLVDMHGLSYWANEVERLRAEIKEELQGDKMIYTKEDFKEKWDGDEDGGGITWEDIADCAEAWGLFSTPRIHDMWEVRKAVIKACGAKDE